MSLRRAIKITFAASIVAVASSLVWFALGVSDNGRISAQSNQPEVSEPKCSFWLDTDGNGEGDEPFDTGPGQLVLQDSPVVGGCEFMLRASKAVTLEFDSDLIDWEAVVELDRRSSQPNNITVDRGSPGISVEPTTGMRVMVNITNGHTQRSGRDREVSDRYQQDAYIHQVQIPDTFRVLGMHAVTADGLRDSHEENAETATEAYIDAHENILDRSGELPSWTIELANRWLEAGYPEVAVSIIEAVRLDTGESGGINWWIWIGVPVGVAAMALIAFGIALIIRERRDRRDATYHSDNL